MSNEKTLKPPQVGGSALNDGLGADDDARRLTNAELAEAIDSAWQMQHRTGTMSSSHGNITEHFAALLKEQRKRAESA